MAILSTRAQILPEGRLEEEEFLNWRHHPVTLRVWEVLEVWKAAVLEGWGNGDFQRESPHETSEANARALAQVQQISDILNIDAERINTALGFEGTDEELDSANLAKTIAATGGIESGSDS
jgi:hypothetical protein